MDKKPAFLVSIVVLGLVVITALATVTSTRPKPAGETVAGATRPDFSEPGHVEETNVNETESSIGNMEKSVEVAAKEGAGAQQAAEKKSPAKKAPAKGAKAPTRIAWETSFEAALKKAKASGKPVMVDFYADWCGACKHLDANIYTATPVIQESAHFINVKVDADKRTDLQEKYQVAGLPTIVWINSLGNEVKRLQGAPHEPEYMVEMMKEARTARAPESVL